MSINKFTTLLDLSRQAKIITGETATFDGKIEVGIPFSGYPTGVDTGTTVSLGVVSNQTAVFSGNTGTTLFDVSNVSSPNYSSTFSGYTATTWTNPLFSGGTSGLTLPITTLSADTQIVGPFWTLTQTGYTGEYIIGTQYTGYSITYSFNGVSSILSGTSFSGFTTASQENFSAGTLDYKGPLDYLQSVEDATIDGRLYTNKITISNGASASTIGYVLTQTGSNGEGEWLPNSSADTNTYVTGGTLSGTDLILDWNNGGTASPIDLSSLSGGTFTGNTSASCISDIYVSKIHSCSPLEINPLDEGDIVVGSNNNFYFDVTNNRFGIGKVPSLGTIDIETTYGNFIWRPNLTSNSLSISGGSNNQQQFVSLNEKSAFSFIQMGSGYTSNPTIGNPDDSCLLSFDANNLNIITKSGGTGQKNIKFFVGSDLTNPSDIHIQGTGATRGFVGFGTANPTSKVDIIGNINIRNGSTASIYSDFITGGGSFTVSGSTNLPRLAVAAAPYLSKPLAGGSVGMRCWDDVTFVGYGKVGDMHVYASNEANGLNIINSPGTNPGVNPTEDYIRFYAGLQADDGTAHIHIQGSGATIGYVGIGTETPDSLLTVNGKTKTTQFQMISGATNGYVLTSDASGNATWQLGGSGTFSGGTVTGLSTFTAGLSANTISATTIGSSGNCITDLYVSSIHSCSPLRINPLNEGEVVVGSNNNFYFDVVNNRIGIGKIPTLGTLDFSSIYGNLIYRPFVGAVSLSLSGNSDSQSIVQLINGNGALSLGKLGNNSSSIYGISGDTYLSSVDSNNLNFITLSGFTGGQKNIRFYVGQGATTASTADIHIQGTGATRGFVGIGTVTPDSLLTVNGKTKTTTLQLTSGATNGYVLTSDGSGNATWQVPSGGGSSVTTATTTTINFTGQTIYYNATSPATGNISENLTGASLGLVQKIYHNDTSEPAFPGGWVLMGDAIYFTSTLNIIYAEWAGGSRVEYWYVQEQ